MHPADYSDGTSFETHYDVEELRSYKYILGEFGVQMLLAVARGAENKTSIQMLSGVPHACITGRMPVLLNLKLLKQEGEDLFKLTSRGHEFLKCIKECF
ncbi:hypothetical protein [Candidatus Harpocratesius sp.]